MNKRILSTFLILFIIILFSSITYAEDDLNIRRWLVDAVLLENGDLQVSEDIIFDFQDSFNGVYRNISLDRIESVNNISIKEITGANEISYEEFDDADKGDTNKFTLKKDKNNLEIKIFSPSKDETKTFRLQYLLKNLAIKQEDTGELYYKFLGEENETSIDYFSVNLKLPSFEKEKLNIFAHGPVQGKIYFSDKIIKSEVKDVQANTFIENRILFPKEYIFLSNNIGNKDFNSIIDEERSYIDKIEKDIEDTTIKKDMFSKISVFSGALMLLIILFTFYKFRRNKDLFDLMTSPSPETISPAELSLFINKMITPRAFLASVFDLSYKGYIELERINKDNKLFANEYTFTKIDKSTAELLRHEATLLDWTFNSMGDGKAFTTLDLEEQRLENSKEFYNCQKKWNKLVKESLKSRNYYDLRSKRIGRYIIFISIGVFIIGLATLLFESLYGLIGFLLGIVSLIYGILLIYRTNDKGYIQYKLWKDFQEKIKNSNEVDFDFDEDKTLIYALALDMPMKHLEDYRTSVASSYYPIGWGYLYFVMNKDGGSQFEDTFNNRFYGSSGTSSSSSQSFGSGGGFSGGGGGGAGGGGAGGF